MNNKPNKQELPFPYETVMLTYKTQKEVDNTELCEVTNRAFYVKSDGYYDYKDNYISTPDGYFMVPDEWSPFAFGNNKPVMMPHTFAHTKVLPSHVIKWEYDEE